MLELPLSFVSSTVLARRMDPHYFGQYTVIAAGAALFVALVSLGGEELVQRTVGVLYRSHGKMEAGAAYGKLLGQRVRVLLCVNVAILIAILPFLGGRFIGGNPAELGAMMFLGTATSIVILQLAAHRAALAAVPAALSGIGLQIAVCVVAILAPTTAPDTVATLVGLVYAVRVIIMAWTLHRAGIRPLSGRPLNPASGADGSSSWASRIYLGLNTVASQVLGRQSDLIIAASLGVSSAHVAEYALAFTIATILNTALVSGLGALALTFFADAAVVGPKELGVKWRRMLELTAFLSAAPLAFAAFAAEPLVLVAFGPSYAHASTFLVGLCAMT